MPLLLHSAASATKKGLPLTGCSEPPVQKLFDTIIPALLDALKKVINLELHNVIKANFKFGFQFMSLQFTPLWPSSSTSILLRSRSASNSSKGIEGTSSPSVTEVVSDR